MFLFPSPTGDLYFSITSANICSTKKEFPSPTGDLYFSISICTPSGFCSPVSVPYRGLIFLNEQISFTNSSGFVSFPSPTGDLYFSIPSPQFLVNTDCITQFAWEMIFQKYKFIFHYKKLSKCLFYAVRGKTNIF